MAGVLFLMGLSGTLARYFCKVVHRVAADSPKVYNTQFWLQVVAVVYLAYIFLSYWHLGLYTGHWFLKFNLLFFNVAIFLALKIIMIETSQVVIIRDIAIINVALLCYL